MACSAIFAAANGDEPLNADSHGRQARQHATSQCGEPDGVRDDDASYAVNSSPAAMGP